MICAYAPTNNGPKEAREKFYSRLHDVVTPQAWLLGDLNARVGRRVTPDLDCDIPPPNTIGPWSLKGDIVPNENGALLINVASDNKLRHIASHFACRDSKRWTWRHPRYASRAVLDHVFLPAPQVRFVCRHFVAPTVSISTDHRLVITELCFRPRFRRICQARSPPLNKRACKTAISKKPSSWKYQAPLETDPLKISHRTSSQPQSGRRLSQLPRRFFQQ